jgi:hypothetical protein
LQQTKEVNTKYLPRVLREINASMSCLLSYQKILGAEYTSYSITILVVVSKLSTFDLRKLIA